jgi:hypothetical protein
MRRELRALLACLLLAATTAPRAQDVSRAARERIAQLPSAQRDVFYRREAAWRAMAPAQRAQLKRRIAAWHALPAAQRREQRERWQAWQALPPDERARMAAAAAAFAALPVQAQLDLRARYAQLDDAHRRGYLLGPTLGAGWPGLQPLLMHVPAVQRDALLAALRAMSPQQRADLSVLAQRTPPQERAQLRAALLATPAARRGAWLVRKLEH